MRGKGNFGFSLEEQKEIWRRHKSGESLSDIGRALRKNPGSVHRLISHYGGISPTLKKRAKIRLSLKEREEISRGLSANESIRSIATRLGRAASSISREIKRHGGKQIYRAIEADNIAWKNSSRPKPCILHTHAELKKLIEDKLALKWSPQQISGWLKLNYPGDITMHLSHETIYRSLFIQARGLLKKELCQYLRSKRMMRRSKQARIDRMPRGQIIDGISIRQRPPEVEDRAIPGHWEGDLVSGSHNTHIATLVERQSRFALLVKLEGKDTISVINALKEKILSLPQALRLSLTWDRGMELARHKQLTLETSIQVYFCDPQSPWQRGTNENTNRLIRQYLPKGTNLSLYSQKQLDAIASELNLRPRKTLNFMTPFDTLNQTVAMTS